MNREEAIIDLKAKITRIKAILDDGLCANLDRWAIKLKWHEDMLAALHSPQPDPITGLAPCGCGGKVEQEDFHDGFFPYSRVTCRGCWTETTRCRCTTEEAHKMAMIGWNASHGYTAPPRPGAIGPGTGEMAPNGDEGATHE